uniref:Peptidase M14 domain-containing protein n=1 Tax=candidate division WOR-3 bacterium TaxID=2052148 RepID=A0A7C3URD7_UNCW3
MRISEFIGLLTLFLIINPLEGFGFPPRYHTYQEMEEDLIRLAHEFPHLCRLETLGFSTRLGRAILGIKISDFPQIREDEPRLLFNGNHHAAEIIGPEICLFLAESLLGQYETNEEVKRFVDSLEIWIVPMVNPDGHWIVEQDIDTLWRKDLRDNDTNGIINLDYDGVDLNRNYDFLWERGVSEPSSREYRGPAPFSEGEICALRDLAERERFVIDVCYHSDIDPRRGEYVYFPWLWGNSRSPDYFHLQEIACSLAFSIPNDLNNGTYSYIYGRAEEGGLARNWFYYALGIFSFTVEVSRGYRPPEMRVDSICRKNLRGCYYLMRRALSSQITGRIYDATTQRPLSAEVRILEAYAPPETILPRFSDSIFGRFRRLLLPGRYRVLVLKEGYEMKMETVEVFLGRPTEIEIYLQPSGIEEKRRSDVKIQNFGLYYTADGRRAERILGKGIYFKREKERMKKIVVF